MNSVTSCEVCGKKESLLRCARCKRTYYCSKEHQTENWRKHKAFCSKHRVDKQGSADSQPIKVSIESSESSDKYTKYSSVNWGGENKSDSNSAWNTPPITYEGSSETEILSAKTEILSPSLDYRHTSSNTLDSPQNNMPSIEGDYAMAPKFTSCFKTLPDISSLDVGESRPFLHKNPEDEKHIILDEICINVIKDMDAYGLCVVDNFLGPEKGNAVLEEVQNMYSKGVFKDGQLVNNKVVNNKVKKTIRGDQITWIDGKESMCTNIGELISQVDLIIMRANKMKNNGKMSDYNINGRTKAMVACYPGNGTHYVKHVDNPNRDGRCITAIYYLNKDWDINVNGGLLRIFPLGWRDQIANIEPIFDRILFFWSDRRNPHEVQPAHKTRYAITLWYFDSSEREEACKHYQMDRDHKHQQGIK